VSDNPLDILHRELRECRRCLEEGYWIAPGPVFSGGAGARVMLIGQAPGITEGQVKRPFNAGSGRRLFQWLGEAGWDEAEFRAHAYMTAVTKCYPGPSGNGKGDRVATPFEQALCRPWLEQEVRLINPTLMLLVGGLAIKLLYPANTRLAQIIGTAAWFPPEALAADPLNFNLTDAEILTAFDSAKDPGGRWIVPLPHPSGVSLWYNRPENRELVRQAIELLGNIRDTYRL
jgi:uracil-DNA glycosylase